RDPDNNQSDNQGNHLDSLPHFNLPPVSLLLRFPSGQERPRWLSIPLEEAGNVAFLTRRSRVQRFSVPTLLWLLGFRLRLISFLLLRFQVAFYARIRRLCGDFPSLRLGVGGCR